MQRNRHKDFSINNFSYIGELKKKKKNYGKHKFKLVKITRNVERIRKEEDDRSLWHACARTTLPYVTAAD